MPQDFSGKNLRGRSFKGQNLNGADFSGADIRGADFTDAKLIGANFRGAKAGLQRRWVVGLVVCSWLLAGLSGYMSILMGSLASNVSHLHSTDTFIAAIVFLITFSVSLIVIFRVSLVTFALIFAVTAAVAVAVAVALAFAFAFTGDGAEVVAADGSGSRAFALAVTFALDGAVVFTGIVAFAVAVTVAKAVAGAKAVAVAVGVAVAFAVVAAGIIAVGRHRAGAGAVAVAFAVAFAVAVTFTLAGAYIGRLGWNGDEKYALVRSFAVAFAATGGTSFRRADLTDANFTQARLKSTDFRGAILTRTCWHHATMLDRVRPGVTYLQNNQLRQLLVTGLRQNKNFDGLNLRGLNLSEANLTNASFIGTDFYQSSLKEANLTGSLLVRTHLESTDLTGATLTGACIEDWVVTRTTTLNGVKCKHIFMKLELENKRGVDRLPLGKEFENDGFILFIQSVLDTIKLYHERDVNPRLALYVLQSLSVDYQCTLEVVKYERRGENGAIIEVKVPGSFIQEKFKETYYEKYDRYLKLYMSDPKNELKSPINLENIAVYKGNFIAGDVIDSNVTSATEGSTIMPSMSHSPSSFSIGGSVGGNASNVQGNNNRTVQGDDNEGVLGDSNQVTQRNQMGAEPEKSLTKDDVIELLAELKALIQQAELPADIKEEVTEDLSATKKATDKEEPNKKRALERLTSVTETLNKASETVDAGQSLWSKANPIIIKVIGWLSTVA